MNKKLKKDIMSSKLVAHLFYDKMFVEIRFLKNWSWE